jgi:hypothetical protein
MNKYKITTIDGVSRMIYGHDLLTAAKEARAAMPCVKLTHVQLQ